MRITYSKQFEKQLRKAPVKIIEAFRERRKLFHQNPLNPLLHNHALSGKMKGLRSIYITGDWRAIYSEVKEEDELIIVFEMLGTHCQLYR